MKRIDVHAHIIPSCVYAGSERDGHWHGNRIEQDDAGRDVLVARGRRPRVTPPSMRYTPSERAQALDAMNVDMHLLSLDPHLLDYEEAIDTALAGFREINDDMGAYARAQPDRFMGLATLPMQDGVAAAEELERAVTELGLKGMELCAGIRGGGLDDPAFDPVWAAAERLDAAIFVHPDPNAPIPLERMPFLFNLIGNPIQTTIAVYSVIFGGVLDRFPNLKFCFAHGGGLACYAMPRAEVHGYLQRPRAKQAIKAPPSEYLRRMRYDTVTHSGENLQYLAERAGVENIVMGSDFPFDPCYADPVAWVQDVEWLTDAEREGVLGGNARRWLAI